MTTITNDLTTLKEAIESRNAKRVTAWYAEDADLTILDRDNPPAAPATYHGLAEIGAYYRDICGRNMEHTVEDVGGPLRTLTLASAKLTGRTTVAASSRRSGCRV